MLILTELGENLKNIPNFKRLYICEPPKILKFARMISDTNFDTNRRINYKDL